MQSGTRFNILLTEDRPHTGEQHWTDQLPRLLQPQGVEAFVASTGRDAIRLAERFAIHAAVIDMGTPLGEALDAMSSPPSGGSGAVPSPPTPSGAAQAGPAGLWLLELFRRMPNRPPVVLLRKPAYSRGQAERILRDALRLGAFSVMNKPVELEQLLAVFQRLVDRRYSGAWPGHAGAANREEGSFPFRRFTDRADGGAN
jgi:CheY-like chemotaxis protein